jgi:hypothetical protein
MSFGRKIGLLVLHGAVTVFCVALSAVGLTGVGTAQAATYPTSAFDFQSWTIAGNGSRCASATSSCGDGGAGAATSTGELLLPWGVAVDAGGNVYIADQADQKVRKVTPSGALSTIAGNGTACATGTSSCGDGGPGSATSTGELNYPLGVAVDSQGNVYIADDLDNKVRKVTPAGVLSTIAGNGTRCPTATSSCGDGGPGSATSTGELNRPWGVAVDAQNNVYIADTFDNKIRKVTPSGALSTIAGNGTACATGTSSCGDGGPGSAATTGEFNETAAVAVDGQGNVYIADRQDNKVREVTPSGALATIAGTGASCSPATSSCGDSEFPGSAPSGTLSFPSGVAVDGRGNIYIADSGDNKVREVTAPGALGTIAGTGNLCPGTPFCGDGGAGTSAQFGAPAGVAVDAAGNLFIGDTQDYEVRWLTGPQAGSQGPVGLQGPTGPQGTGGAQGPVGPPGAVGPAGPRGSTGQVELVVCNKVTQTIKVHGKTRRVTRQHCTTQLISGPVKFTGARTARAILARSGVTYAEGIATHTAVTLHAKRELPSGHYILTLTVHRGRRRLTSRYKVTVAHPALLRGAVRAALARTDPIDADSRLGVSSK